MAFCDRCDRSFINDRALEQHVADSSDHHVCSECLKDLSSAHGLLQHAKQKHGRIVCEECPDRDFVDENALRQHRASKHQRRSLSILTDADASEEALESGSAASYASTQDGSPSVHQPECYACPAPHCERLFASGGALMQHLEGGVCAAALLSPYGERSPAGVQLPSLVSVPVRVDQQHANNISVIAVVSTHSVTGRHDTAGQRILAEVPSVVGRLNSNAKFVTRRGESDIATEDSWNGARYECVLCHKTFMSLPALNNHLRATGGVHKTKVFRCKHANGSRACGKKFRDLKEMVEHLEEAACGVKRFKKQLE